MRITTVSWAFTVIVLWGGIACSQSGDGLFAPPYAGPLIDNTRPPVGHHPATGSARFMIILVRETAILLDTATGETWHLVFIESEDETRLRWQSVPKGHDTSASPTRCKEEKMKLQKAVPSSKEPLGSVLDPFPKAAGWHAVTGAAEVGMHRKRARIPEDHQEVLRLDPTGRHLPRLRRHHLAGKRLR